MIENQGDDVSEQFEHAVRLLHSHNPQISQDGFDQLRTGAAQYLGELIAEFARESDHAVRCRLLDLIGDARDVDALPVLVEQLHGDDESLRARAVTGLERLDTKAAHFQLGRARASGLIP